MITLNSPIYQSFKVAIDTLSSKEVVIDIGTSKRFTKELYPWKDSFEKNYLALGYEPDLSFGDQNCDLNGDMLSLPFINNSIDGVICLQALQCCANPFLAVSEFHRVLKPQGIVVLTTAFLQVYVGKSRSINSFDHNTYPDLWRFTQQGLEVLFQEFSSVEIAPFSNPIGYYANYVLGFERLPVLSSRPIQQLIDKSFPKNYSSPTDSYLVVATK